MSEHIEEAVEIANAFVATCDWGGCNEETFAVVWMESYGSWLALCCVHAAIESEKEFERELATTTESLTRSRRSPR